MIIKEFKLTINVAPSPPRLTFLKTNFNSFGNYGKFENHRSSPSKDFNPIFYKMNGKEADYLPQSLIL